MAESNVSKSPAAPIAAAWLLVVVPTGWGLTYTVQNALKLFTAAPASTAPPVSAPAQNK